MQEEVLYLGGAAPADIQALLLPPIQPGVGWPDHTAALLNPSKLPNQWFREGKNQGL